MTMMKTDTDKPQVADPKEIASFDCDRQLSRARFTLDGAMLVAGGFDASVRRWKMVDDKFEEIESIGSQRHHGWVDAIALHPDAKTNRLFTGDTWGTLCCWSLGDDAGEPVWSIDDAHDGWIRGIAVSPDGKMLATCGRDRAVKLRSAEDGKPVRDLPRHDEDIYAIAFAPDGRTLVTGDEKGVLRQWNVETGDLVREFDAKVFYKYDRIQDVGGLRVLAFDHDGRRLFAGGSQPDRGATMQGTPTILVFDTATGDLQHTMTHGEPKDGHVVDLHIHKDGYVMAVTTGVPGNGRFYFHRVGEEKPFFETKVLNCHALAVHPDGRHIVVTSTNRGSNGNGRKVDDDGNYIGNYSPLTLFQMGADASA